MLHGLGMDRDHQDRIREVSEAQVKLQRASIDAIPQGVRPNLSLPLNAASLPGIHDPLFIASRGPSSDHLYRPLAPTYNAYLQLEERKRADELQQRFNAMTPAEKEGDRNWASQQPSIHVDRARARTFGNQPLSDAASYLASQEFVLPSQGIDEFVQQGLEDRGVMKVDSLGARGGPRSLHHPGQPRDAQAMESKRLNDRMKAARRLESMVKRHQK